MMSIYLPAKKRWLRWLYLFGITIIILLIMPLLGKLLIHFNVPLGILQASIEDNKGMLLIIRWGLLATLIMAWPLIVQYINRDQACTQQFLAHWTRWRLVGWLVVIELLFVQGFLLKAFQVFIR